MNTKGNLNKVRKVLHDARSHLEHHAARMDFEIKHDHFETISKISGGSGPLKNAADARVETVDEFRLSPQVQEDRVKLFRTVQRQKEKPEKMETGEEGGVGDA